MLGLASKLRQILRYSASIPPILSPASSNLISSVETVPNTNVEVKYTEEYETVVATPFLNVVLKNSNRIHTRSYKTNSIERVALKDYKSVVVDDTRPIKIVLGEYDLHHSLTNAEKRKLKELPAEYFKEYLEAVLEESLPPDSFIAIASPTKYDQKGNIALNIDPTHIFGFATDGTGYPEIETHIDFIKSNKDPESGEAYVAPLIGYTSSNGNFEAILSPVQSIKKGAYMTHKHRCIVEMESIIRLSASKKITKKVAIVILPRFDYFERCIIKDYLIRMIGVDDYHKIHEARIMTIDSEDQTYILGGGYKTTIDDERLEIDGKHVLISPRNCGVKLFEAARAHIDVAATVDFDKELFSAFPINALVLLVEQRFGFKVAAEVAKVVAKEAEFRHNLERSRYKSAINMPMDESFEFPKII